METGAELTAHLTTGAVVVYALEWLKSAGWCPWISADTKRLNRVLSAILAATAAVGIGWTYEASQGTLVITGLTASGLLTGGYEWIKQFSVQQLLFDGVIAKQTVTVLPPSPPQP